MHDYYSHKKRSDNTSGYVGVFYRSEGKYRAFYHVNNKKIWIGTFPSAEAAAIARDAFIWKLLKLSGSYNFPERLDPLAKKISTLE